jgi:6,7-dimethyl-8-ribityllumazine synthase
MATVHKNLSEYKLEETPKSRGKKITIIVSKWNDEITDSLKEGAVETLKDLGVYARDIKIIEVPGCFELAFAAKQVITNHEVDAVICVGCVIKGETSHFDYVCQAATNGIQKLNVQYDVPVVFCVLTDDNIDQSKSRSGGNLGNKGVEAAVTAAQMIKMKEDILK